MKSTEVYSLLKSEIGPWLKAEGFKRAGSLLSWCRPSGDSYTVLWFQVSRDGWDAYAGSRFAVEFQRSAEPLVGAKSSARGRIASFLSASEREDVRAIQNSIVAEFQTPPKTHPPLNITPEISEWYLSNFKIATEPYPDRDDIWFHYSKPEHVRTWSRFILSKLPDCIAAIEA